MNVITGYKARKSFFVLELPEYKAPSVVKSLKSMLQRGWAYIVKAGTIILICNFIVYLMQNFSWTFRMVENSEDSILATIATPIAYIIAPVVGAVMWKLAAAAVTGFIAKECVVGTLATLFAFEHLINEDLEIIGGNAVIGMSMGIPAVAALAFLMFNLFSPPCFAAIGAMNSEIKSKKWLWAGIGLQFAVGYTVSFLVNFFGTVFSSKAEFESVWMPIVGWMIVLAIAAYITYVAIKNRKEFNDEYALKSEAKEKSKV